MSDTKSESAIEFPCYFPIKIIGKNSKKFRNDIKKIITNFFPGIPKPQLRYNESKQKNYISITATVYVFDQITLDQLYKELTKHPDIQMVL